MHSKTLSGGSVSLRQTFPKGNFIRGEDIFARSVSADWQSCRPGDVYFALTTPAQDGHEFAEQAVAQGASAIVAERLLPIDAPQLVVRDSRAAFSRVCQALAGNPSRQLRTVGVAGTAGKTVTAMLIASVFEAAGQPTGVVSSIGNSDSLDQSPPTGEAPTARELATWMQRMVTAGCKSAVLELPCRALAERRAAGIGLDVAVLTNVKSGASAEFNSAQAYQAIQQRALKLLKADGLAIVNADDYRCRNLLAGIERPCLTYGLHAEADITAEVLERSPSEQSFLLSAGDDCVPVRTTMIGDHHVSNCLAAAAVGLACDIDLMTIVRGLEKVDRVPLRLERLECGQPFSVFVDSAKTAETLSLAIKTARQVTTGRVLVVFAAPPGASRAQRAMLGRVLERGAHVPVLTSGDADASNPLAPVHDMLDGFERAKRAQIVPTRARAIEVALATAKPGDTVLIAGADDRCAAAAGEQASPADDREIVCAWLYGQSAPHQANTRFWIVG